MPPAEQQHDYEFILNPPPPKRKQIFANAQGPMKLLYIVGAFFVLIIVMLMIKAIFFSGSSKFDGFITVTHDQQQLLHIINDATQQDSLSTLSNNVNTTAQLVLSSDQANMLTYLSTNGHKLKTKNLDAGLSSSIDKQLTAAASAATYDHTYQEVMLQQLNHYLTDLKSTYQQNKGPKGRALLSTDYKNAQLLLQQLSAPAS